GEPARCGQPELLRTSSELRASQGARVRRPDKQHRSRCPRGRFRRRPAPGQEGRLVILIPPSKQAGPAMKAGSQFTGEVFPYLTMAATDGVTINTVNFTPCARTYWHSHEKGQILIVVAGRGLVQ